LRIPVIYNQELVEVDKNNNLYGFGVPFKYGNRIEKTSASLDSALLRLRLFSTDWEKVQKDLGYAWNEEQILKIIRESTN